MQKRRQPRSLTAFEDLVSHNETVAVPVSRPENKRPPVSEPTKIKSQEGGVRFNLPSSDGRSRSEKQEKGLRGPGPLSTLPEDDVVPSVSASRRGFLKSITDRFSGQKLPKSPV
jgi:hypothetical protein